MVPGSMHRFEDEAGIRLPRANPASGEAQEDYSAAGQHHCCKADRWTEGELVSSHPGEDCQAGNQLEGEEVQFPFHVFVPPLPGEGYVDEGEEGAVPNRAESDLVEHCEGGTGCG